METMIRERLVRDVMTRGVVCCPVGSTARDAVRLMGRYNAEVVVVLNEMAEACGVITQDDLLRCYGKNLEWIRAEALMTPHVVTIAPTASLAEAASLMRAQRVRHLVVPKGDLAGMRPVGLLSIDDVIKEMAR